MSIMRDLPEASRVFVFGTAEERSALQARFGLTDDDMRRFTHYATLRHNVLSRLQTDGDCSIEIEPQVAEAVRKLNQKGYKTFSSGFASAGEAQHLSCSDAPFHPAIIPEEILDRLADFDLQFIVTSHAITFQSSRLLSLEELTFIWNRVADALPPRTT